MRLNVPAFPCWPVSTQPFRDLLLMWKLAQPQCSVILDFCFANTSYVVGDMTWTSYLSFPLQQLHWEPHFISVRLLHSSQSAVLTLQLLLMGAGVSRQTRERLFSLLSPAPSPLPEHSGCAVLHSSPPCSQTPLPSQSACSVGVLCWETVAGAKSWCACPNAVLCDVSLGPWSNCSALEGYWFWYLLGRNDSQVTGTLDFR